MRLVRCVDRASRAVRSRDTGDPRAAARRVWTVTINDASSRREGRPTVNTGVPTLSRLDPPCGPAAKQPHAAGHFRHPALARCSGSVWFELTKRITS